MDVRTPRRVLVVGGGPCGLVTQRNLVERGEFEEVLLVERRDDVGGVWYLEDAPKAGKPHWPSPAYPGLVGNVLPEYLSFSGARFPPTGSEVHPYPTLKQTHAYLKAFAEPYIARGHIRLEAEVVWVDERPEGRGWDVTMRDWTAEGNGRETVRRWDAVVVATAWYDFPSWPDTTPGLAEARERGLATHAQAWMGPEGYKAKRVAVVGNANSSNDIAAQLKSVAHTPVYRSIRRQGLRRFAYLPDARVVDVPPIARYTITPAGNLDLLLADGRTLTNIDHVVLGTGYKAAAAPFVRVRSANGLQPLTSAHTSPPRIPSLYAHILYAPNPSLAFIGTVMSYTPFTLADVASTWLCLVWRNRLAIPHTLDARLAGEQARIALVEEVRTKLGGDGASSLVAYHILAPAERAYAQGLKDAIRRIHPPWAELLPDWSEQDWVRREAMYERKWMSLEAEREAGVVAKL
ncbi:FAD/NAD(P)-binding domain-containing protein [Mycena kentingensis (nom. inval.)]|nr:FAD/NAD(P)-binding domain-containing protein [Mycena kentingensis (nom. inval.)]